MEPIIYNKLVRDKIPSIISAEGRKAVTRTLETSEFEHFLRMKLLEEAQELFETKDSADFQKEAADVMEVIMALADHFGVAMTSIEDLRIKRARERGAFRDRIFLESVYEKHEQLPENE